MAKRSYRSMGTRLGNMKKIESQLKTYSDYSPASADLALDKITNLIDTIEAYNLEVAVRLEVYTTATDIRQKAFLKGDNSLSDTVVQVSALVSSSVGRGSKEAATIQALSVKIRGASTSKKKKPKAPVEKTAAAAAAATEGPDAKTISRSERTFGNMSKLFDDVIATLQSFAGRYNVTGDLSVDALRTKATSLHDMNDKSNQASMQLQVSRDTRAKGYVLLSDIAMRVKDGVKGQYGIKSPQYLAIKGIQV